MLPDFIKMEFFRMSKMKALIVLPIVMTAVMFLQTFFLLRFNISGFLTINSISDEVVSSDVAELMEDDLEYGMFDRGEGYFYSVTETFESNIHGQTMMLIITIMAGLFFGSDYSTHIGKNYPNVNGRKWIRVTAQMLVMAVYLLGTFINVWAVSFLSNSMWANSLTLGITPKALLGGAVSYLAAISFISVICFITTLFKSKAAGLVLGILSSVGILALPISILDFIISARYDLDDFSLNYLLPSRILASVGMGSGGKVVIIASICAIIYLVLSFIGSVSLSSKRDMDI